MKPQNHSRVPVSGTAMLLLLPVFFAAWGRFGQKVPVALGLSLLTGLLIRAFAEVGEKPFPWACFWVFPLFVPLGMPLWLVPLSLTAAWIITISAFGGIGRNIFNPVVLALVFIMAGYGSAVSLTASKPFSTALAAINVWTAGINPIEPALRGWLTRPVITLSDFLGGGHLPAVPGLAFPGPLLLIVLLIVLLLPARRIWFFSTMILIFSGGELVAGTMPELIRSGASLLSTGVVVALLLACLADENTIPEQVGEQLLFSLILSAAIVVFACGSTHELAPVYGLLLTQAIFPMISDVCGGRL